MKKTTQTPCLVPSTFDGWPGAWSLDSTGTPRSWRSVGFVIRALLCCAGLWAVTS